LFPLFASVKFFGKFLRVKPILEISNLRIERSGVKILTDVSWRVERGQHWVILGANGSGKTSC
jgi:ABC-type molybdenum transport system ATPase subunit/photorepair protein PhrA